MFKNMTGEALKGYKKKIGDITIKTMDKYAQTKKCPHDRQIQIYMYSFMSVDPETITVEEYFSDTKTYIKNQKKISTPVSVPKHWLGFSYIRLEYYELDMIFDSTELKNKTDHSLNDKVKYFCDNILVIEE